MTRKDRIIAGALVASVLLYTVLLTMAVLYVVPHGMVAPPVGPCGIATSGVVTAPSSENVTFGASNGTQHAECLDGVVNGKTEGLTPFQSAQASDAQVTGGGALVAGSAPPGGTSLAARDGSYLQYRETDVAVPTVRTPDRQTLDAATMENGSFPGCLNALDGSMCEWSETSSVTQPGFLPAGQTVALGSQVAGSFPTDLEATDGRTIQYREGNGTSLTQDYAPTGQDLTLGLDLSSPTYAQGTFTRKTDGPGLQTVTGVGFQGKALILWWTRQAATGLAAGQSSGMGFVAGSSQQYAVGWANDDNVTPSNAGRRSAGVAIEILQDGTPTVDGEASFVGFTNDGWTLNWLVNPNPSMAVIVHYVVLGPGVSKAFVGQFVGPAAGVTGLRSYAGVGFRGDVALFMGSMQTALGSTASAAFGFGAATGPLQRAALSIESLDGASPTLTQRTQDTTKALIEYNPALAGAGTDQLMDFDSFGPDGFTLNHTKTVTGDVVFWAMLLQGGTYSVSDFARPTVTGPQHVQGVGFRPSGVVFFGTASIEPLGTLDTRAQATFGAGATILGGIAQDVTWSGAQENVTPSKSRMFTSLNAVIEDRSLASGSLQNRANFVSSDPDGFTLNWTAVQTAATQDWFFLAIGPPSVFPACVRATDGVSCTYGETSTNGTNYGVTLRYSWTGVATTGKDWRLFVTGAEGPSAPERIDVSVFGSDGVTLSAVACTIQSTSNATYDCGSLTPDQLNGGRPSILFQDEIRAGDSIASTFSLDRVFIERTYFAQQLNVTYAWSGIPVGPMPATLQISGYRQGEDFLVQLLTPPSTWTTRLTVNSSAERDLTYALTLAEFNGGAPTIRFVDVNTTDETPSSVYLDLVRVVEGQVIYSFSLTLDWTSSVSASTVNAFLFDASRSGAKDILVQAWDWQDGAWLNVSTVNASALTLRTVTLSAACTAALGDCQISASTGGSVRIRFIDSAGPEAAPTSLLLDLAVVRTTDVQYALSAEFGWTAVDPRSAAIRLEAVGHIDSEAVTVQVWNWSAAAWETAGSLASTGDTDLVHVLSDGQVSPTFAVRIRFLGSDDGGTDLSASNLWLDYVAVETSQYRLDVVDRISGIPTAGVYTLRVAGRLGSVGDNVNVSVWDWAQGNWTPWLSAPFTSSGQSFARTLQASEIRGGAVLVHLVNTQAPGERTPNVLLVDLLVVESGTAG